VAQSIASMYEPGNGRPSRIANAEAVQILLSELERGTHPDPAAELAGISVNTVRNWVKRGEANEEPFATFLRAYKRARAKVESNVTQNIIEASKDPRFWAAGATYLERTHPDRWGRRTEDSNTPKVIVQVGVSESAVQVHVGSSPTFACSTQSLSEDMHRLSEAHRSDNPPDVNQEDHQA
jgi:hypothetical protein